MLADIAEPGPRQRWCRPGRAVVGHQRPGHRAAVDRHYQPLRAFDAVQIATEGSIRRRCSSSSPRENWSVHSMREEGRTAAGRHGLARHRRPGDDGESGQRDRGLTEHLRPSRHRHHVDGAERGRIGEGQGEVVNECDSQSGCPSGSSLGGNRVADARRRRESPGHPGRIPSTTARRRAVRCGTLRRPAAVEGLPTAPGGRCGRGLPTGASALCRYLSKSTTDSAFDDWVCCRNPADVG